MTAAVCHVVAATSPGLAFLDGIGGLEMVLVAFVGLLLFGGKGLPDMARTLGKVVREFKKATASVENEVKRVMDEEPEPRPRPRPKPRALPPGPTVGNSSAHAAAQTSLAQPPPPPAPGPSLPPAPETPPPRA